MLFKTSAIGLQYASLHPALRRALTDVNAAIVGWGLPELTLTDAVRTKAENVAIYLAVNLGKGMSPVEAREDAERRWSWHICSCAADFRSSGKHYSPDDWRRVLEWMRERYKVPMWEVLTHDLGFGMHAHLGYRDFDWRRKWEQQEARSRRLGGSA